MKTRTRLLCLALSVLFLSGCANYKPITKEYPPLDMESPSMSETMRASLERFEQVPAATFSGTHFTVKFIELSKLERERSISYFIDFVVAPKTALPMRRYHVWVDPSQAVREAYNRSYRQFYNLYEMITPPPRDQQFSYDENIKYAFHYQLIWIYSKDPTATAKYISSEQFEQGLRALTIHVAVAEGMESIPITWEGDIHSVTGADDPWLQTWQGQGIHPLIDLLENHIISSGGGVPF